MALLETRLLYLPIPPMIINFPIENNNFDHLHLSFKGAEGAFSSSKVPVPPGCYQILEA